LIDIVVIITVERLGITVRVSVIDVGSQVVLTAKVKVFSLNIG
jgi:hypothetical protein